MTTKTMHSNLLLTFLLLFGLFNSYNNNPPIEEQHKIEAKDIDQLLGEWSGTLTYLDYRSKKPYSMPCELLISEKRKNKKLLLEYIYPKEPKANNKEKIKISKNGSVINGKKVASRLIAPDGHIEIFTEISGKDGNEKKDALIREIFEIGKKKLKIRKEVKFIGSEEWVMRNEYSFKKK